MAGRTEQSAAPVVDLLALDSYRKRLSVSTGETLLSTRNSSRVDVGPLMEGKEEEEEEDKRLFSAVDRGAPGDAALLSMTQRKPEQVKLARQKSQFYSEVFAYRETMSTPRERVAKDSVISAVIVTNVIIADEGAFLRDFSSHLSQRYQRPMASIMLTLEHSKCMIFGGSFDAAYQVTITALACQVQATINKRNAALIQMFLEDELHVAPNRGVVRFEKIAEEDLATNGATVLGEIEALQKHAATRRDGGGGESSLGRKSVRKRMSIAARNPEPASPTEAKPPTVFEEEPAGPGNAAAIATATATVRRHSAGDGPSVPGRSGPLRPEMPGQPGGRVRKISARKSFMNLFKR